ncbi:MAG: hypothetical protein CMJ81_11630 [Planctomycetaceae bacterium]|nr:hypothetical protein [Planctomycetaceae bacterium]MBP63998.1 hypothetical protein [Planctomycetaceae bacterium]
MNHHHRLMAAVLFAAVSGPTTLSPLSAGSPEKTILLSEEHLAAARRDRRIIINFDTISGDRSFGGRDPAELVKWKFHVIDTEGVQIDSVWWGWGEGHQSPWPSEIMPLYDAEGYRKWASQGIDIAAIFAKESKKRGIEAFYSYRINGSDNDLGPFRKIPMKSEHPEWLIHTWPGPLGYWNFAIPEVRQYKLSILREIAERYDYDGIALDFARVTPVLPPGQAWSKRDKLTEFIRDFRRITLEVSRKRGRPILVGARIPENLPGCHFDGLDIETWVRDGLVDVLALGVRSFDVDLLAFRRLIEGTHVKLYPCVDDHHASDGYATPPIEIYRGVAANWWQQGADGINTFNFNHAPDFPYGGVWETHLAAYRQIGSPETLRHKNKIFVVQRRGGGHGPSVIPNPEDWTTPRWNYFNTNMFAPLPAPLANDGRGDTLLMISVADDVSAESDHLKNISLRLLLSDPAAEKLPPDERLQPVLVATIGHDGGLTNTPPARGIEKTVEVRLNNIKLGTARPEEGWLVFQHVPSDLFAVGENLVGVRVCSPRPDAQHAISIEKLEVHVNYH